MPKEMVAMVRELFVMVYKGKGSKDDMAKYHCICMLTHAYKLLSTVLLRRLASECEDWLPQSQAGFSRPMRGGADNIFILSELIADVVSRNMEAFIVSLTLSQPLTVYPTNYWMRRWPQRARAAKAQHFIMLQ